jgi:hypothetical protein
MKGVNLRITPIFGIETICAAAFVVLFPPIELKYCYFFEFLSSEVESFRP